MSRRQILTRGIIIGIILLALFGCQEQEVNQLPTPLNNSPTVVATVNRNSIFLPFVENPDCQGYRALLDMTIDKDTLSVGDSLRITLALHNTGCSELGLFSYQIQPPVIDNLKAVTPRMQTHYFAMLPGDADSVVFVFKAAKAGKVSLSGQADFEVNLTSGPPLNGHAETKEMMITVNP